MTKPTLLIIGAAGNNGKATIEALTQQHAGHYTIRAGVRSSEKAQALVEQYPEIETTLLDLNKPETLTQVFKGVDKLFLILGNVENREEQAKNAIDAAVATGSVKHIVFYSVFGSEYESILFGKQFRAGEKYLEQSGIAWTHLRPIFFQDNFFGWAEGIKQGALYLMVGTGQYAPLNISDIGEIAANVLTSEGHEGQAYGITGPELLSGEDMAAVFSEVTGKQVDYVSPDRETTLNSLLESDWPEWQSHGMLELFDLFAANQAAVVSPDGEKLLGRPLTTLKQFVHANKEAFI